MAAAMILRTLRSFARPVMVCVMQDDAAKLQGDRGQRAESGRKATALHRQKYLAKKMGFSKNAENAVLNHFAVTFR